MRNATQPTRLYDWPFFAIFAAALGNTLDLTRRLAHFHLIFWDAKVYARAIHAFAVGADPYTRSPDLNFVYSPTFLVAGSHLSHLLPPHLAWGLYLLLNGAAVFLIPVLLVRFYLQAAWLTPAVGLTIFFFHPLLTAQTAFTSGNICSLLYAIVLAAGIPGMRRNRWLWFFVAVALASIIKPTFLAFLLLPVLAGTARISASLLTVASVTVEVLLERRLMPTEYGAFVASVYFQVVTLGDTGFGLLSRLNPIAVHIPVLHARSAYPLAAAILVLLVFGLWRVRSTYLAETDLTTNSLWIASILTTAILANLRLLAYDADIAILPATFVVVESLRSLVTRRTTPLAIAAFIAIFSVVLAKDPKTALLGFLMASVLLVLGCIPGSMPNADESSYQTQAESVQASSDIDKLRTRDAA